MLQFVDPETADILQFLYPEIVKMDQKILNPEIHRNGVISGSRNCKKCLKTHRSRNCRNGAISGSRNGQQIL